MKTAHSSSWRSTSSTSLARSWWPKRQWPGAPTGSRPGTPLIKSEGLQAVRELHARWPDEVIVADMKTMDAGRAEVEFAAKAGARVVGVLGAASDATIRSVWRRRATTALRSSWTWSRWPMSWPGPKRPRRWAPATSASISPSTSRCRARRPGTRCEAVPQAVVHTGGCGRRHQLRDRAAGHRSRRLHRRRRRGHHQAVDATAATRTIKQAIETLVPTEIGVLREGHRPRHPRRADPGLGRQRVRRPPPQRRHPGPAPAAAGHEAGGARRSPSAPTPATGRSRWKPSMHAQPGDVLVIDAGGVPPAIWGELATTPP